MEKLSLEELVKFTTEARRLISEVERFSNIAAVKPMKAPFPARGLRQDWTPAALIHEGD